MQLNKNVLIALDSQKIEAIGVLSILRGSKLKCVKILIVCWI